MADATTAARDRIDRAFALLEERIQSLKASGATASADEDLFAAAPADQGRIDRLTARVAELEAAGRAASDALGEAAALIREAAASSAPAPAEAEDEDGEFNEEDAD